MDWQRLRQQVHLIVRHIELEPYKAIFVPLDTGRWKALRRKMGNRGSFILCCHAEARDRHLGIC